MAIRVFWRRRCKDGSEILLAPSESKDQTFSNLVLVTLLFTFGLITLGGVVRATGSGLGCPDWPTCVQLDNRDAYIEVSHRLVAAVVGFLVLVTSIFAWRTYRKRPWILLPTTISFILLVGQIVLGGITVLTELPRWAVMAHLVQAEAMIAVLLVVYVASRSGGEISISTGKTSALGRFPLFTLATAVAVFTLLITGSYIANTPGATYACGDSWPLCKGELFPSEGLAPYHMGHRMASLAVGVLVATTLLMAWRIKQLYPQIWAVAGVFGLLFLLQVLAGAANQWLAFPVGGLVLHLSLATGVWMGTTLLAILALSCNGSLTGPKTSEAHQTNSDLPKSPASQHGIMSAVADRIRLTKPPIITLLLITALGGMFLAAQGPPPALLIVWLMVGGAMAAGGANSINHGLEQKSDSLMLRTRSRPVPAKRITARSAVIQGIILNAVAFIMLATQFNLLTALFILSATLFYILVYTSWLKRTTPQNIVIGGAAGSVPPLAGWAAVTGGVDLPAIYLFAIIFFWTPPHFWALSLLIRDDYARAGVPMLPVVSGVYHTVKSIMLYSLVLVALTIMFFIVPEVSWIYLFAAMVLGGMFLYFAWRLLQSRGMRGAKPLYLYSLLYLALIFTAVIIDSVVTL